MKNPVHKYLMCSYAYYRLNENLIPDGEFDELANRLLAEYPKWKDHPHCPTEDDLRASTYLGDYPTILQIATRHEETSSTTTSAGFDGLVQSICKSLITLRFLT